MTTPEVDPVLGTVHGFMADGTPDVFNESSIDRIFESGGALTGDRQEKLEMLKSLLQASYAPNTRTGYNRHVVRFCEFCATWEPPLEPFPATPETVALWVADLALHVDPITKTHYQTSTVGQMVAAVGRWHVAHKLANPVTDAVLGMIRRGYGNTFGRNAARADPVLREALLRLVETTYAPTAKAHRVRALLLAITEPLQRLGPRVIERIRSWDQFAWPDRPDQPLVISVPYPDHVEKIEIHPNGDPGLDLVAALRDLHSWSEATGAPFPNERNGHPMTASGASRLAKAWCERAGICRAPGNWWLPEDDRRRLNAAVLAPMVIHIRDRALLLMQWWAALRRGEVAKLKWQTARPLPDDPSILQVVVVRGKKDQEGRGKTKLVHSQPDVRLDLKHALEEWRRCAERILGRPVRGSDPLFFRLDQAAGSGGDRKPMTGDAVNERVKAVARVARLQGRISSHSLRAGFATQAFDDGAGTIEVMEHLGQDDPRSPLVYKRGAVARGKRNPTFPRNADSERDALVAAVLARLEDLASDGLSAEPIRDVATRLVEEEIRRNCAGGESHDDGEDLEHHRPGPTGR